GGADGRDERSRASHSAHDPVAGAGRRAAPRILGSGILLDHETFNLTSPLEGLQSVICRLGKFQPFGMKNAEDIYQLCPVESSPDQDLIEQIVESFEAGKWDETTQLLNRLDDDHLFGRLLREFIKESGDRPPSNWDRTIPIRRK
ncbi:MAG: hypothetical protein AAF623_13110, partial [Planctomycetota bacterium]